MPKSHIVHKDKNSLYPPISGYKLNDEQMRTIAEVGKLLIAAEGYLEQDSTEDTADHFGDFMVLHMDIHRALEQVYHIMRVHNAVVQAEQYNLD